VHRKAHTPLGRLAGIGIAVVISISACGNPTLKAIAPSTGYPRQLLAVDGDTLLASVIWDIGRPTETALPAGFFGTRYFQIPKNASQGLHPVAIATHNGISNIVWVSVLEYHAFPAPRIEDVAIMAVDADGAVNIALTVAAANLDVDASVKVAEINGESLIAKTFNTSMLWGALPVDYLQHHKPETFGYPIYHYAQLIGIVENVKLGSTLQVVVTNNDNLSAMTEFPVPPTLADWDSDGDGLLDSWEDDSFTAPSGNQISLAGLGVSKFRKDILVEVDWIAAAKPQDSAWQIIEATFANAPVLNPDGSSGIHLIVDRGQGGALSEGGEVLADHDCLAWSAPPPALPECQNIKVFREYKAAHFDSDRLAIFHYAIFGRGDFQSRAGRAETYGNDFYVTLFGSGLPSTYMPAQVGTFIHELGHNLGLSHGNLVNQNENYPFKPNFPSVMNYRYPFGVDRNCDLMGEDVFSYSEGSLRLIDEANANENVGVCDTLPVDLNWDGDTTDTGSINVNVGGVSDPDTDQDTVDIWNDFDQWGNLLLDFNAPGSNWGNN
jgi:hypothetical protein